MPTAIWWVRRDQRLNDNDALRTALETCDAVVPVFILDPALLTASDVSPRRVAFMLGGLAALDADLRTRGSRLVVRRGAPGDELARLVAETGAVAIYAEADPWPYGRRRDAAVPALNAIPGVSCYSPDATFYLYPDVTDAMTRVGATDYDDFRLRALHETGCSFCTRVHFGSERPGDDRKYVRIAYSGIDADRIEEGLGKMKAWVESA